MIEVCNYSGQAVCVECGFIQHVLSTRFETPPTCGVHSINRWPTVLDKSALYGSSQGFL